MNQSLGLLFKVPRVANEIQNQVGKSHCSSDRNASEQTDDPVSAKVCEDPTLNLKKLMITRTCRSGFIGLASFLMRNWAEKQD